MDIVFEEQLFFVSKPKQIAFDIRAKGWLTATGLSWFHAGIRQTLSLDDVVGVKPSSETYPQGLVGLVICAYPTPRTLPQRRCLREYRFVCGTEQMRSQWINVIQQTLQGLPIQPQQAVKPRTLQVLINPKGGTQQGKKVFDAIRPILENANCHLDVIETQGGDITIQTVRELDLTHVDGFVVVGGDGTVHELINGLMTHPDVVHPASGIYPESLGRSEAITKPIGIIPAGTGNGLGKTILSLSQEAYDPINAAFIIAKGQSKPINLGVVEQDGHQYYSILSLAWALISDIDINSNKLRFLKFLGSLRSDIYAVFSILTLRSYPGKVSFVLAPDWPSRPPHKSQTLNDYTDSERSVSTSALTANTATLRDQSQNWCVIEDDFIGLWVMNVAWAAHSVQAAPHAQLADGYMDVLIIRKGITRWRLLTAFLKISTGEHLLLPDMEYYKIRCLRLEPQGSAGLLAVDGEQIDHCPVQLNVLPNHAQVFCR